MYKITALRWIDANINNCSPDTYCFYTEAELSDAYTLKIGNFMIEKSNNNNEPSYIYLILNREFLSNSEDLEVDINKINYDKLSVLYKHDEYFKYYEGFYLEEREDGSFQKYNDINEVLEFIKFFEDTKENQISYIAGDYKIEVCDWKYIEENLFEKEKQNNSIEQMERPSVCLETYYWDNCQTTGQMKTKYIKIMESFEKVHELIRTGVFFTLKQDGKESLGVGRLVYLSNREAFDMSINLEDIKILFTPKDEFVFDFRGRYYLNGEACSCDLANSLCKTTFSDNDGRIYLFNNNGRDFSDKDVSAQLILKTWFIPKINCLNMNENKTKISTNYAPSIDLDNSKYYKDMNGNFVMSSAEIVYGENNNKKEKNMFNNLMKNFKFGKMDTNTIKYSFNGIAFQTEDGDYVVYNPDMTFTNVSEMVVDIPIYVMPVSKSNIKTGDIIIHNGEFVIVQAIENKEIRVARPRTREVIGIIPEKSIFGFDFYTKVIDFIKNFNNGASSSNPFGNLPLLMMTDNKDNNNDMLMFMMMNGGRMDINNPMFMYMMMSKSDDKSNLLPLMMLMNQNKNEESTAEYKINNSKSNIVLNPEDLNWHLVD